jgi:tripartite-type tricarboxylate transporter receptor subunit TctC
MKLERRHLSCLRRFHLLGQPLILVATAGLLIAGAMPTAAQQYPTKPVRLIVAFPPGGSGDIIARTIATQLGARLGKQVIVDNRAGAAGVIAAELVANAPRDGHTLLMGSLPLAVNPWLYKLPYDPIKAFAPVAMLGSGPNVLLVNPDLPVQSVKDLIARAKENPGKLRWASGGVGGFQHVSGELFGLLTGTKMLHIPFKGAGPALIDVIGGHTQLTFAALIAGAPHIRSGKLRALGTGGTARSAIFPDVPTIEEAGVPGYAATNWWGILAPAGTPAPVIAKLHTEISAVQGAPDLEKQFANEGLELARMSSAEFGTFFTKELDKWERVVKEAGIKAE